MKTRLVSPPPRDLGFVVNSRGDLIPSRNRGVNIAALCGWKRVNGDLVPDTLTEPLRGFWAWDADQNLIPRRNSGSAVASFGSGTDVFDWQ